METKQAGLWCFVDIRREFTFLQPQRSCKQPRDCNGPCGEFYPISLAIALFPFTLLHWHLFHPFASIPVLPLISVFTLNYLSLSLFVNLFQRRRSLIPSEQITMVVQCFYC